MLKKFSIMYWQGTIKYIKTDWFFWNEKDWQILSKSSHSTGKSCYLINLNLLSFFSGLKSIIYSFLSNTFFLLINRKKCSSSPTISIFVLRIF